MDTLTQSENEALSDSAAAAPVDSTNASGQDSGRVVSLEERHRMIETAAYYRAQQRCFPGHDNVEDWLDAEIEVDAMLAKADPS